MLDEPLDGEEVGKVKGSGLSEGTSFWGVGPEGSGHEPAIVMPKILTQGRWNLGSCGKGYAVMVTLVVGIVTG